MIYTIPYESDNLQQSYIQLLDSVDPITDEIHLTVKSATTTPSSKKDIYLAILQMTGEYRQLTCSWTDAPVKVRVVTCP